MSIATRTTKTTWTGDLPSGKGSFGGSSSGVLDGQEVTWGSRTKAPEGKSSPEELLAAAHSSCFSMAFAATLGDHDLTPDRLEVSAEVALEDVDGAPTITTSHLTVRGAVSGIDGATFAKYAEEAGKMCPVSRLFSSAKITVDAQLA